MHFIDRYKKNILNIPQDTPLMPPIVEPLSAENIATLHKNYFLDKDRTIIICPYARTVRSLPANLWEVLAKVLTLGNFIVYTNVDGVSEKPIEGTESITPNFSGLAFISDKVKCFMGIRSGVFDLLAMTNAKILCIQPFPVWHDCLNVIQHR